MCPPKINFRFLRDTYSEQLEHYKQQSKNKNSVNSVYEQYADSKLVDKTLNDEAVINISTEYVRGFVKLNDGLKGKFLKSLRKKFSANKAGQKIILEITTLHELGHFISTQLVAGSLIARSHKKNDEDFKKLGIENNHLTNISRNILEGFSDCFSTYLVQKHYPQDKIVEKYLDSRKETIQKSSNSIPWYDVNGALSKVNKIQDKDIDLLINDFLNIAIDNSIKLTKDKIINNPKFEQELKFIFDLYAKDLQINQDPNKSLLENIECDFKKTLLTNKTYNMEQANFNIQKIRNSSLSPKDKSNGLKPY